MLGETGPTKGTNMLKKRVEELQHTYGGILGKKGQTTHE